MEGREDLISVTLKSVCCVSSAGLWVAIPSAPLSTAPVPGKVLQAICMQSAPLGAAGAALETGHQEPPSVPR